MDLMINQKIVKCYNINMENILFLLSLFVFSVSGAFTNCVPEKESEVGPEESVIDSGESEEESG